MTINDKQIIYEILSNNGYYPDDPRVSAVFQYLNMYGDLTHAVFYDNYELHESPYVRLPLLLWDDKNGLTHAGKEWLLKYKEKI